jgi:hypothetical protein
MGLESWSYSTPTEEKKNKKNLTEFGGRKKNCDFSIERAKE